jgi:hypothetical protein
MTTIGSVLPALRALLAWCEAHPDIDGHCSTEMYIYLWDDSVSMANLVRALGKAKKEYADDGLWLKKNFSNREGEVLIKAVTSSNQVCTRRVIGTKQVPEQVIPAHVEEIVEWDCGSILKPQDELPAEMLALPTAALQNVEV